MAEPWSEATPILETILPKLVVCTPARLASSTRFRYLQVLFFEAHAPSPQGNAQFLVHRCHVMGRSYVRSRALTAIRNFASGHSAPRKRMYIVKN